jgi:hypothetical protein
MMMDDFDTDPYPGRPKILFIGVGGSTHTHAWIDLLSASDFNVRLFALPDGGIPPATWKIRTYLPQESHLLPEELDHSSRKTLHPFPEVIEERTRANQLARKKKLPYRLHVFAVEILNHIGSMAGLPVLQYDLSFLSASDISITSPHEWLHCIINEWKPDLIHTLGLDPAGYFYDQTCRQFPSAKVKWVLQLRGGSDLALNRLLPDTAQQVEAVVRTADQIISDNRENIQYLRAMKVKDEQLSTLIPVPGTGGLDVKYLASLRATKTSQSREIVFPKGYELAWSKCLPVFEALQLCWEQITPCRIHILNVSTEIRAWFYALPAHVQESCILHERISREDFFTLLAHARVLLIPSLVDGVPNSMYEAMALSVLPIVSPLATIQSVVEGGRNVLFARNLYPQEIASALTRAMTDDVLVDTAAGNNLDLVAKVADRSVLAPRVIKYYEELAGRM